MDVGMLFQHLGPATEKARSPKQVFYFRTARLPLTRPLAPLQRANGAHPAYSWRHGQIWGLELIRVLNLFHAALQCALISG